MTPHKAQNTFGIPFLRTGPKQLVSVLNQILAALDAVRIVQGGVVTPTGTIVTPSAAGATRRPSAPATPTTPATVYDLSDYTTTPASPTFAVGVRPFLVNGIIPKIAGTALDAATPPSLAVGTSEAKRAWLKCVGTFGGSSPDSYVVTIELRAAAASDPSYTLSSSGFTAWLALGDASATSGALILTNARGQSSAWSRVECEAGTSGIYWWSF